MILPVRGATGTANDVGDMSSKGLREVVTFLEMYFFGPIPL